ncbi:MAG TPA: hypothetical protein VFD38_15455 [Myxococcaceae bacterium]|nr:hypothetical protein [Myxococcaceae bacterium]
MSRVQSAGAATPIHFSVQEQEPAAASAHSRRFEPVDLDRIEFDDLQPAGAPGRTGTTNVATGHLTFHGGKVLRSADVVPVYVGAYWETPGGKRDRARNDAAMAALVKDPGQTGIWKEYGSGPGTTSPSKVIATVRHRDFSKEDVEMLVEAHVRAGTFDVSDPERVFTIVLPPGATLRDGEASSTAGLGGFHGNVTARDGHPVYYAVVAYSQRTGGRVNGIDFTGTPIDNVTIAESHEITEAVTDPDVGLAIQTGDPRYLGWYDDTTPIRRSDGTAVLDGMGRPMRGKGEIGDIPVLNAELEGDSALKSVWGRRGGFAFQTEWSNRDGKAELAPRGSRVGAEPRSAEGGA